MNNWTQKKHGVNEKVKYSNEECFSDTNNKTLERKGGKERGRRTGDGKRLVGLEGVYGQCPLQSTFECQDLGPLLAALEVRTFPTLAAAAFSLAPCLMLGNDLVWG